VHHFHTRTKTARAAELNAAAPEPYVEIHPNDAQQAGIVEGDMVQITNPRGNVHVRARIGGILPGHVFLPFHYGYWDQEGASGPDGRPRAANELTATTWDPVSKQPQYKFAAVRIDKLGAKPLVAKVTDAVDESLDVAKELASTALSRAHREQSRFPIYLGLLRQSYEAFQQACGQIATDHAENDEIVRGTALMRRLAEEALSRLQPFEHVYGTSKEREPRRLRRSLFPRTRHGDFGLLRDLQALSLLASEILVSAEIAHGAAQELRDAALVEACEWLMEQAKRQRTWCLTVAKENAAQALVVKH
jgi:hypothetical protein